jgi:signal transduction histidine kinase
MQNGARRLPVLLLAAIVIPLAGLGWLGLRTVQQERELEGQRLRERLEVASARVALEIERRLQVVEEELARGVGVQFRPNGVESSNSLRVLFQPVESPIEMPPVGPLAAAEIEEFQRHNLPAAEAAYRRIALTSADATKVIALAGLARVQRLQKQYERALDAYDELERLGAVPLAGQPAALVARQGRVKTLEAAADQDRLRSEVHNLSRALASGDWRIDRPTFEMYREMVARWNGPPPPTDAVARTEAIIELWHSWRRGDLGTRGRRMWLADPVAALAVWGGNSERLTVWLATTSELQTSWQPIWQAQNLSVAISDVEGRLLMGMPGVRAVTLSPSDTRLPFILSASTTQANEPDRGRHRVLAIGLMLAFGVTLAAAYALYRTTTRELSLARQQADFVAAVSHEFRTPLTSMRHLTELLESRAVVSEERKSHYYQLLARETERLHRMVESLLTFGRMDLHAYNWQLEPAEVERIVTGIVEEFRSSSIAEGRQVYCEVEGHLPVIRADREALSRALWNLLENAAKYSAARAPIHVFARQQANEVLVGVRDEGTGIPQGEQRRIFQKFVRGSDATRSGIRGVGIGLALVTRIVEAHGGSVHLESEPGRGSTFTLVLPCLES